MNKGIDDPVSYRAMSTVDECLETFQLLAKRRATSTNRKHTQLYWNANPTCCMNIKRLRTIFETVVGKDQSPSIESETEGSAQDFETPEMDEVLRENQTADEL